MVVPQEFAITPAISFVRFVFQEISLICEGLVILFWDTVDTVLMFWMVKSEQSRKVLGNFPVVIPL